MAFGVGMNLLWLLWEAEARSLKGPVELDSMEACNSAFAARLQAPSRFPTVRTAPESSHTHRHLALPLSNFTHDGALAAAASPVHRHSVAVSVRRRQAIDVVSAIAEREHLSSEQERASYEVEDGHPERRASSSCCDDVGAFLARKATFERIQACGAIACLRSDNEEVALSAGRAALDGGVSVLEVTMRTMGAFQVIKKLVHEYPSATIGAGTVLTRQDTERAKEAGATFLMSPVTDKELVQVHSSSNVLFIPSAMTPSEILQARRWGASCVKLYPVSLMGGIQYVKMLKQLFPHIPIIPANGISLDAVESYLQLGATAVVTSEAIFNKTALAQHDYDQIAERAKRVATIAASSERADTSILKYTRNSQRFRAVCREHRRHL